MESLIRTGHRRKVREIVNCLGNTDIEINNLVETLKKKLKKKYPEKSDRKIEREINDKLGFDYPDLFNKNKGRPGVSPRYLNNLYNVSTNIFDFKKQNLKLHKINKKAEKETFDKLKLKNPLLQKNKPSTKSRKKLNDAPMNQLKNVYQPYLYQNSGVASGKKIHLSGRGIIASQEIKEEDVRKQRQKKEKDLKSKVQEKMKKKSKRNFEDAEKGGINWQNRTSQFRRSWGSQMGSSSKRSSSTWKRRGAK